MLKIYLDRVRYIKYIIKINVNLFFFLNVVSRKFKTKAAQP
jgi:hypothetical protein